MKLRPKTAIPGGGHAAAASALAVGPRPGVAVPLLKPLEHSTGEPGTSTSDLDSLLVSANIAMILLDRRKCIRRFTPAATSLFSLLPGDIGRSIRDLARKFSDPTFFSDVLLVLEGGGTSKKEVQSDDGRWYVRQALPYRLHDGSVDGAVVTFSDVAADALQEARLYAESIVNSVREPLLVLEADLRVRSINQPFSKLFQLTSDEVVGCALRDVGDGLWDVKELLARLKDVFATGTAMEDFEIPYVSGPLGKRELLVNARTLGRDGGRPDLILVAVDDATQRRNTERLLQENETRHRNEETVRLRQLELANALRLSTVGELATGLAHELNQPLSSISNVVEACTRYVRAGTSDPAKLLELLAEAANQSIRAAGIVSHLRSFVEKGEPQLETVDLGEVIGRVPSLMTGDLERSEISLRIDVPSWGLPVRADRIQIEQVLVNLLQNGMDSIREAEVTERVIELSARSVGGMVEISVRDTGTGVSESAAERMFEPFFTTKKQGLGMGLALSRSILEAHRGRIWMEAPPDGGSGIVVRFSIPLEASGSHRKDRAS